MLKMEQKQADKRLDRESATRTKSVNENIY